MQCPNKHKEWDEWICLCPSDGDFRKKAANMLGNNWVSDKQARRLKELAENPRTTDQELRQAFARLEESASLSCMMWRFGN